MLWLADLVLDLVKAVDWSELTNEFIFNKTNFAGKQRQYIFNEHWQLYFNVFSWDFTNLQYQFSWV